MTLVSDEEAGSIYSVDTLGKRIVSRWAGLKESEWHNLKHMNYSSLEFSIY